MKPKIDGAVVLHGQENKTIEVSTSPLSPLLPTGGPLRTLDRFSLRA